MHGQDRNARRLRTRLGLGEEDLERWALRREKLLVTLDPRAARRIRDMIAEVTMARAAFLTGSLLARAGIVDMAAQAAVLPLVDDAGVVAGIGEVRHAGGSFAIGNRAETNAV